MMLNGFCNSDKSEEGMTKGSDEINAGKTNQISIVIFVLPEFRVSILEYVIVFIYKVLPVFLSELIVLFLYIYLHVRLK